MQYCIEKYKITENKHSATNCYLHLLKNFRFPNTNNNQEEGSGTSLDASFMQFIAENYPAYTCIFQLVLPRFTMLDLTSFKNAVMLFRLGKVGDTDMYCIDK